MGSFVFFSGGVRWCAAETTTPDERRLDLQPDASASWRAGEESFPPVHETATCDMSLEIIREDFRVSKLESGAMIPQDAALLV
jgi:hypothetical protein